MIIFYSTTSLKEQFTKKKSHIIKIESSGCSKPVWRLLWHTIQRYRHHAALFYTDSLFFASSKTCKKGMFTSMQMTLVQWLLA